MYRSSFFGWTLPALFLLAAASPLLRAQQGDTLTLQRALEVAEQSNLDLLAARLRRAQSLARIRIAGQRPNPTFTFGAARDLPHENVLIEQPFELGSKRSSRIEVAKQEGLLTDLEIAALGRQVRRNTRAAYYRLAQARAETEFLDRARKLTERVRQIAQDRFDAGAVAQLEVVRVDADVARAEAEFQVSQQREKIYLSQVNVYLNQPATKSWQLAGSLEDVLPGLAMEDVVQKGYSLHPDLQHLAQELRVAESRLGLLKAERTPNLSVQFGVDLNAPPDFQVGPRGQIAVTLPLFSRNQGEIAESQAIHRLLESQILATRRTVAGNVERAYFELQALQTQVRIYREKLLPTVHRVESMAEESYSAGKSDILFVLDARRNVQDVERNYLASLAALQVAVGALEEAVGGPLQSNATP